MISKVKETLNKARKIAENPKYKKAFNSVAQENNLLIVYDVEGLVPASTLLNLFLTLKPTTNITLIPLEVFYSVQAPYFSKPTIVFLTDVKNAPRASDTLRILSIPHIVFIPKIPQNFPLHKEGFKIIELPEGMSTEELVFTEMMASTLMLLKTLSTTEKRIEKVQEEVLTIESIIEDLLEHYREECDEIIDLLNSNNDAILLYTELLKPIAQYLYYKISLSSRRKPLLMMPLDLIVKYTSITLPNNIIVLRTGMEEEKFRAFKVRFGLQLKSRKVIDVGVKTDPLTVPYYAFIILWHILDNLKLQVDM